MIITKKQNEVIVGGILGDASICRNYLNYRFKLGVQKKDFKFINFVYKFLSSLCKSGIKSSTQPPYTDKKRGYTIPKRYRLDLQTRTLPQITIYKNKWYKKKHKIIPNFKLTDLIFAIWIAGDGSRNKKWGWFRISTESFYKKDVEKLCLKINNLFNIDSAHPVKHYDSQYTIYISRRDYETTIVPRIKSYMLEMGMERKLP